MRFLMKRKRALYMPYYMHMPFIELNCRMEFEFLNFEPISLVPYRSSGCLIL